MLKPGSVKICSLREVEHARFVLDAGADLFGLIFVPGVRRQITAERALEIVTAVRTEARADAPLAVGVFVDASADEVNRTIRAVGIDLVQLHGVEPPEMIAEIDAPVIKAFRPMVGTDGDIARRDLERYMSAARPPVAMLIDGFDPGQHGGAGVRADWPLAAELARAFPVMLAGGLKPENVVEAIATVDPFGVDVGSGVETDGTKDAAKIAAFVSTARGGFRDRAASGTRG